MVHTNLSYLSDSKHTAFPHSSHHCDASSLILESLHGHNVNAYVSRVQVHQSGSLFPHLLAGMGDATERNQMNLRKLDLM
jgi:hypothetical protein